MLQSPGDVPPAMKYFASHSGKNCRRNPCRASCMRISTGISGKSIPTSVRPLPSLIGEPVMPKRNLRIVKRNQDGSPSLGICEACNAQFRSSIPHPELARSEIKPDSISTHASRRTPARTPCGLSESLQKIRIRLSAAIRALAGTGIQACVHKVRPLLTAPRLPDLMLRNPPY
jgi:hypothetical protein